MEKLSVIIPVFNEIKTLKEILEKIEAVKLSVDKEIIVVDDNSTDGCREYIRGLAKKYKIVLQDKNRGKGNAIHSALPLVTGEYVIIQDADLEYDPKDYQEILNKLVQENLSAVYGSRNIIVNGRVNNFYYYGGKFVSAVANLLFNSKLTDVNTCYKMFKSELLKSLNLKEKKFSFCEEVTAKILKKGIVIKEVPISYKPRSFKEGKKIRFYDGGRAIFTLFKYRFYR